MLSFSTVYFVPPVCFFQITTQSRTQIALETVHIIVQVLSEILSVIVCEPDEKPISIQCELIFESKASSLFLPRNRLKVFQESGCQEEEDKRSIE